MPRGVPADDAVGGVPVWRVRLITVRHGEVCDHCPHPVFGDFPHILQSARERKLHALWRPGAVGGVRPTAGAPDAQDLGFPWVDPRRARVVLPGASGSSARPGEAEAHVCTHPLRSQPRLHTRAHAHARVWPWPFSQSPSGLSHVSWAPAQIPGTRGPGMYLHNAR